MSQPPKPLVWRPRIRRRFLTPEAIAYRRAVVQQAVSAMTEAHEAHCMALTEPVGSRDVIRTWHALDAAWTELRRVLGAD